MASLTLLAVLVLFKGTLMALPVAGSDLDNILYFGWFLNETSAASLQKYTKEALQQLYTEVPEVQEFFNEVHPGQDPFTYFIKPLDPGTGADDPLYHITAKYCGSGAVDCTEYYETAQASLGKRFQTNLIGFFFTKRTYGVRIHLTPEQAPLFEPDEDAKRLQLDIISGLTNANYPGIEFVPQDLDFRPVPSRAHVTLGCALGVPAVQTGFDLLTVVEYEVTPDAHKDFVVEDYGTLRHFHEDNASNTAFVLYPLEKLVVETTFEAYVKDNSNESNTLETVPHSYLLAAILSLLHI